LQQQRADHRPAAKSGLPELTDYQVYGVLRDESFLTPLYEGLAEQIDDRARST
jgi:hypothetical protein